MPGKNNSVCEIMQKERETGAHFAVGLQTAEVQPLCIISTEIQDGRSIRSVCLCIEKSSIRKVHSFGHRVVSVSRVSCG